MKQCFRCGISEEKSLLYEGISKEGIVFVCRKCSFKENMPLVEKKNVDLSKINSRESVRKRLLKLVGIKEDKFARETKERQVHPSDVTLRDIVEKNFKEKIAEKPKTYDDLIDNFHWVIMRKRRAMKITAEQFAKEIFEPTLAVESAEKGILPNDYSAFVLKLERCLNVKLFKEEKESFDLSNLSNESKISSGLKIKDLKEKFEEVQIEIPKKIEKEILITEVKESKIGDLKKIDEEVKSISKKEEKIDKLENENEDKLVKKEVDGLSQKELDDIIFGRKK
ncbi:MAG: hypothetical protein WC812_00615 [Candidatus Pacearchaeota archaeon]|jgi:ribosome-binding protein aMBF1 (putative translation factor)